MSKHELVFLSTDDDVDDHTRPAHDMVLSMAKDGRVSLASEQDASFIFDDPDTGQSFTIIAFKSYTIMLGTKVSVEGKPVTSVSGYINLKLRNLGLVIQDPLLFLDGGQTKQILGKNLIISPDDTPSIFDDTGACIYSPVSNQQHPSTS